MTTTTEQHTEEPAVGTADAAERQPDTHPRATGTPKADREAARQTYRESVAAELPLTGAALGAMYGRGERWGRDRVAEVRREETDRHAAADERHTTADDRHTTADDRHTTADDRHAAADDRHAAADDRQTADPDPAPTGMPVPVQRQTRSGRAVAWLAFIFGVAASVTANVLHAKTPKVIERAREKAEQVEAPAGQNLDPEAAAQAAQVAAAFWPLALLLAVEVLTRVQWPDTGWYALARYGGTGVVAAVAAIMSYRHMAGLLEYWGEDTFSAAIGPLAVDGLMVVAAAALLAMSKKGTSQ